MNWIEKSAMKVAAGESITDDFIRALRIIKRLRAACRGAIIELDGLGSGLAAIEEIEAALEYEGEG